MYIGGWQFQVLSPIFSVHWGLLTKKSRPSWRERQNSNNRRKFPHFKKEIFAKYNKDYNKELEREHKEEMKMLNKTKQFNGRGFKMHHPKLMNKQIN